MSGAPAWPVAVVGGGVAAAAAGLALAAAGVPAVVVAPRRPIADRVGESLPASAQPLLERLGLAPAFAAGPHRASRESFAAWGTRALLRRPASGWVLDRAAFDRMLADALDASGLPRRETMLRDVRRRDDGGWLLALASGEEIACRFVIDASGRASAAGRRLAERSRGDRLVAFHAFLPCEDAGVEPTPATVIEAGPAGWWYAAALPDRRIGLAWFTDADLAGQARGGRWPEDVAASRFVGPWLASAGCPPPGRPAVSPAGTAILARAAGDGWAAAGDAAAAFDPLSSHGIVSALWMGLHAAEAAAAFLDGDGDAPARYAEAVRLGVTDYLAGRAAMYGRESRWAGEPFWARRGHRPDRAVR